MDIPELKYWFTPDAIWALGSFALALWLGVFGIRSMISKWHLRTVATMFAVLSLFGWWTMAKQAREGARQEARTLSRDAKYDEMSRSMARIATAMQIENPNSSKDVADLVLERLSHAPKSGMSLEEKYSRYSEPRVLSSVQSKIISTFLKSHDPHEFYLTVYPGDEEAKRYGIQLFSALSDGGWSFKGLREGAWVQPGLQSKIGNTLESIYGPNRPADHAADLFDQAMAKAKIEMSGWGQGATADGKTVTFEIEVGHRMVDDGPLAAAEHRAVQIADLQKAIRDRLASKDPATRRADKIEDLRQQLRRIQGKDN